ncbi:hypothetical protein [Rhodoferax sp.]|uniref:hypothetical protein n=1 Tax=Rhodoferax sp. TaxID=50421 RepID=UPI00260E33B0|nr:hypothetical protein [Rhodoferax sp.]MDD2811203.1 hypothetical protein [Rhodoferax sp.]
MRILRFLAGLGLTAALLACGGGGGNAGTPLSGAGSAAAGATAAAPTLTLSLVDAAGAALSSNAIGGGAVAYAKAVLLDAAGAPVANKLVTFAADAAVATLAQTSVLTNTSGVASTQISAVGLSGNAGTLTASATVAIGTTTSTLSQTVDFQTTASNVSLAALSAQPSSINALQTSAVSVQATVNGVAPSGGSISVTFAASCGTFSPASASTNNLGVATSTYQSTAACSGPVTVTASASGATTVQTNIQVAAIQAANLVFVEASAPLMVLSSTSGGVKQSTLTYQVLDSAGAGMSGQDVVMSLSSTAKSAGVTFSVGGASSAADQTVSTDAAGKAQVVVSAGTVPTPVVVTASLKSNSTVTAASNNVTVTTGRAAQNKVSLSSDKFAIEGWSIDGAQATLTMRVADRQSNPIPVGSVVNFVASHGLVTGSCSIDANSLCTVTYRSQGTRPSNGRGVVMAYMEGEEAFVDLNSNNIWDSGETFTDLGVLFRDDNEDGTAQVTEPTYPGGSTGATACTANTGVVKSVAGTCDGTWSSAIRVRQQVTIAWSSSTANITSAAARTVGGFSVSVTDINGNAMATDTTVAGAVVTSGAKCAVLSVSNSPVNNSPNAGQHFVRLNGEADCATSLVDVTVTSPSGTKSVTSF